MPVSMTRLYFFMAMMCHNTCSAGRPDACGNFRHGFGFVAHRLANLPPDVLLLLEQRLNPRHGLVVFLAQLLQKL